MKWNKQLVAFLGITCLQLGIVSAQDINLKQKRVTAKLNSISQGINLEKLSTSTGIFLLKKRDLTLNQDSLNQAYGVKTINGQSYVSVFILSDGFDKDTVDFLAGSRFSNITTGLLNIKHIVPFSKLDGVDYLQIGVKANLLLNDARRVTKVNEVHTGLNIDRAYKAEGVVVGIIDIGFDYTHPSFYDSSLSVFRIKRVWDHNSNSGVPPTGYSYGTELTTQNQILNAQTDAVNESHGTHVAGTAAGSGPNTNGLFTGVAPKSDIVLVSTDFNDATIADGVSYIFNYANSVSKPCVINMSIGGHIGPHDGNSTFDRSMDALAGNGKIIVGAAGNEGLDSIHIRKTFTSTDSVFLTFFKFPSSLRTDGIAAVDIWGSPNLQYWTAINIINTRTNQFEDWTPYISSTSNTTHVETLQDGDFFSDDLNVQIATSIFPNNNKANTLVEIDHTDQDDDYRWAVLEVIAYSGTIDLWINGNGILTKNSYNLPFISATPSSTVGEIGGTGKNVISVGAYTSKTSYIDFNNNSRGIDFPASNGEIAPFSSHGPTADNRTKPDITAPGNVIIAPVNSFDANYQANSPLTVAGNSNGSKTWYYGSQQGTSMASPMVAGIIALWLEKNPSLSPNDIKEILKEKSDVDSFTGSIPSTGNNTWGWGKINAYEGMKKLVSIKESSIKESKLTIYPNPSNGEFTIVYPNTWSNEIYQIINTTGQIIQKGLLKENILNLELEKGIYFLQIHSRNTTSRIVIY